MAENNKQNARETTLVACKGTIECICLLCYNCFQWIFIVAEVGMGIYLNPGNDNFKSMVSGDIYVDKTMMLEVTDRFIDKGNMYVCISRPRRFGKTIAGNMLAASGVRIVSQTVGSES